MPREATESRLSNDFTSLAPVNRFSMAKSKRQRISGTVQIYENDSDRTVGLMGNRYEYFIASLMNQAKKDRGVFPNLDIIIFDHVPLLERAIFLFAISRIYGKIKLLKRQKVQRLISTLAIDQTL